QYRVCWPALRHSLISPKLRVESMKLFAKSIENELLYIKNFEPPLFEQTFQSIDELLEKNSSVLVEKYTDSIWMLDGSIVKDKYSVPSAYSVIRLASKEKNYLHNIFRDI